MYVRNCFKGDFDSLYFSTIATFSFAVLYSMMSRASLFTSSELHQLKFCIMSPSVDVFRCLLKTSLVVLFFV